MRIDAIPFAYPARLSLHYTIEQQNLLIWKQAFLFSIQGHCLIQVT
jgi:hypothetical protein